MTSKEAVSVLTCLHNLSDLSALPRVTALIEAQQAEVEQLNKTIEARLGYLGAVVHCKANDDATCRAKIMNALSDWRKP